MSPIEQLKHQPLQAFQAHSLERLAVVILNWNSVDFLRRFLPGVVRHSLNSLTEQGCEVTVVVVDNGSTDGSLEYLHAMQGVEVIAFGQNYGFTGGYNRALERVEADYFLLLNSDVEVTPGWLKPLLALLHERPQTAAVMPKLRALEQPSHFEYAGACGGFIDRLGYPFCRGRILQHTEEDKGQYDTSREVFWATGAAMLVRADAYRAVGGLDEHFFAHMEEIDLCWRFKRQGWSIWVEPRAVVYHLGGGTLPSVSPQKNYLNYRNNLAAHYKNLSTSAFVGFYLLRFLPDLVDLVRHALQGKWNFAGSIFRGHRDFWRWHCRLERHPEWGYLRLSRTTGFYCGSVILRYLFGRHTFGNKL